MTLNPTHANSWRGFLNLLRPPAGYRLEAAVGTSYGLSFDALVAALVAMDGRSTDDLRRDGAGAVIAATRLATRVRVLIHPGTIGGQLHGVPPRLVGLLDRVLGVVSNTVALFHPKVWALTFVRLARPELADSPERLVRVLVGSRNLVRSRSFEVGAVLEGTPTPAGGGAHLGREVADALEPWLAASGMRGALPALFTALRQSELQPPDEGRLGAHLRWQGMRGAPKLSSWLPETLGRAVLVTPFVRDDLVRLLLARTDELRIVSDPKSLAKLGAAVLDEIDGRALKQKKPVLYVVAEHDDPDDGEEDRAQLDCVHAKLLLAKSGDDSVTFLGSANGTGPAWQGANVEAMLELRPGIPIDAFIRGFVLKDKLEPHPWIHQYEPADQPEHDEEEEEREKLLMLLRRVAPVALTAKYDRTTRVLTVRLASGAALPNVGDATVELTSFSRMSDTEAWKPLTSLPEGATFHDLELSDVSAFVAIRARRANVEVTRITLADLQMSAAALDARDAAARESLLESLAPADILRSLVLGFTPLPSGSTSGDARESHGRDAGGPSALGAISLEQVLRAVAEDPDLVRDLRLLVGGRRDTAFDQFCGDLEVASRAVGPKA